MSPQGFHIDRECEAALVRLNDALCSFERATGREYTLILIPESSDEPIHVSLSGKPYPHTSPEDVQGALELAFVRRVRIKSLS